MAHTKGEWKYDNGTPSKWDGIKCYQGDIASENGEYLGIIIGKTLKQQQSNAKLMAAAPDMLEALKKSLFHVELARDRVLRHTSLWHEIDAELVLIKEAIKKATE